MHEIGVSLCSNSSNPKDGSLVDKWLRPGNILPIQLAILDIWIAIFGKIVTGSRIIKSGILGGSNPCNDFEKSSCSWNSNAKSGLISKSQILSVEYVYCFFFGRLRFSYSRLHIGLTDQKKISPIRTLRKVTLSVSLKMVIL